MTRSSERIRHFLGKGQWSRSSKEKKESDDGKCKDYNKKRTQLTLFNTCPLLNDVSARRSLYLALVKSQLSYATQVWSPDKIALKTQIERVQRRATRWILKQRVGVMSYRDRLLTLKLLPLTFDRELKDLVFFYKCRNGFTDLNVYDFVSPVSHG